MPSRIACDAAARAEAHGATPDGEHTGATCGGRKRTHAAVRAISTSRAPRVRAQVTVPPSGATARRARREKGAPLGLKRRTLRAGAVWALECRSSRWLK